MGKRHRRIRARSATRQVAGAATEKPGLEAHRAKRPAQPAFSRGPCPSRPNLSRRPDDTGALKEQFHAAKLGTARSRCLAAAFRRTRHCAGAGPMRASLPGSEKRTLRRSWSVAEPDYLSYLRHTMERRAQYSSRRGPAKVRKCQRAGELFAAEIRAAPASAGSSPERAAALLSSSGGSRRASAPNPPG